MQSSKTGKNHVMPSSGYWIILITGTSPIVRIIITCTCAHQDTHTCISMHAVLPDYCDYQSIAAADDDDESYGICGATCLFWKLCCFISFLPCANTSEL